MQTQEEDLYDLIDKKEDYDNIVTLQIETEIFLGLKYAIRTLSLEEYDTSMDIEETELEKSESIDSMDMYLRIGRNIVLNKNIYAGSLINQLRHRRYK